MRHFSSLLWFCAMLLVVTLITPRLIRPIASSRQDPCSEKRVEWVRDALTKMESVQPGMTREELMKIFGTEGGLSNALHRTFVSRECPYFKVDVEFQAVGRAERDSDGRVTSEEDPRDIIVRISRPYLQFAIAD